MEKRAELKIDSHALNNVAERDRSVVNQQLDLLRDWQALYLARRRYPVEWDPNKFASLARDDARVLDPYSLIMRNADGSPRVAYDREIPELRRILDTVGRKGNKLIDDALGAGWYQAYYLNLSLRPQIRELQLGNYRGAMRARLNSLHAPNEELFMGCFDPYEDPAGIGYSVQGWIMDRDDRLTAVHTSLIQNTLVRTADRLGEEVDPRKVRVITGSQIAAAGIASEWNANTIPSEDQDRKDIGGISFVFPNNLARNLFERGLRDALIRNTPELGQGRSSEGRLMKAVSVNLIFHEGVGHILASTITVPSGRLGEYHQTMKELEAETISLEAVDASRDLNPQEKRNVALVSLSWHMYQIQQYCQERDPIRKAKLLPYAQGGSWALNYFNLTGAINIIETAEGRVIQMRDTEHFFRANKNLLSVLREKIMVQTGGYDPHAVRDFDEVYKRYPISFFGNPERCHGSSAQAVTA